jgi:hypothetical protein
MHPRSQATPAERSRSRAGGTPIPNLTLTNKTGVVCYRAPHCVGGDHDPAYPRRTRRAAR